MSLARSLLIVVPALLAALPVAAQGASGEISEIIVTSRRQQQVLLTHAGNISAVDRQQIDNVLHQHIHELMTRVPGTWLSRGSGQEHLTAIRSPVLTGPGSCGGFLFLEDGIPIRPAGFCNVNQLIEADTEQASAIEVIRGPGNALYGSNALHGIINVLMPMPANGRSPQLALEAGANEFVRVRGELPFDPDAAYLGSVVLARDGGFRDDSGYRQAKLHTKAQGALFGGRITGALTVTGLDQETAGFIVGEDAYEDPDVNRTNPNPEAFRDVSSARVYAIWQRNLDTFDVDIRPFVRYSDMTFLQHFLPGQPLEENGHVSAGALASVSVSGSRQTTVAGVDVEWADVFLEETQAGETEGSDFLRETRPPGKHYDFEVSSFSFAPYFQTDVDVTDALTIGIGLRAEYTRYDYDNRMLSGNTRDDGTPCGFGGCLYTRPADRSDSFVNFAPKLSAAYRLSPSMTLYASAARGFRAPQMTELYRLQSGQEVADLDSEQIDALEAGFRMASEKVAADVSIFAMRKRNSVLRDAEGFNVNGGRTRHRGIEVDLDWQLNPNLRIDLDATYARHSYDFDSVALRGEEFVAGRDVDTAPRWLGSVEALYDGDGRLSAGLQLTWIGSYYLDAENRHSYPGHALVNLRIGAEVTPRLDVIARLNNVLDEAYADRADFAFGNYRYFPGRGRELFVEFRYTPETVRQ